MSIGVSARTTNTEARNNGFGVRQETNQQFPSAYSSERPRQQYDKTTNRNHKTLIEKWEQTSIN